MTIINLFIDRTSEPDRCLAIVRTIRAALRNLKLNGDEAIIGVCDTNPTFNDTESTPAPHLVVSSTSDQEIKNIIEALCTIYDTGLQCVAGSVLTNIMLRHEMETD